MPKIVDPEERRRLVAAAVFRVVRRDGIERATLKAIAAEAGLAVGSVRHYFTSHDELMLFAMNEMVDGVTARVLEHAETLKRPAPVADRMARAEQLLAEFLPLDERRMDEVVVWLEFAVAARTRPELATHVRRLHDGERMIVRRVLGRAEESGRLRPGLDLDLEAERLCAVLDGLAVAAALRPEAHDPERSMGVLRTHLAGLSVEGLAEDHSVS
ncbi:TetR family transcriptional regulator [Actinorhabdospora filicis]|uniref:TetR family transcriptional regulator n=1 Tax=Actinorhabdospora filicis TaxID=1785913 RepID=A0A9W6SS04_9ACTN|nr:TetR family transcriptional regulator C-terminal domain-containing protein [Actinorhabdospora filicis]GLZ80904.1 TetR family transcriptional regulator [Actinorhabdospora filicis]